VAVKGLRGVKEWKAFFKPWLEAMQKAVREQGQVLQGPMFYPEAQGKLSDFLLGVRNLGEAYDLLSAGGQRLLFKTRKKALPAFAKETDTFALAFERLLPELEKVEVKPLEVSEDFAAKGLDYFVKVGKGLSH
jgi:hypothetical protein